MCDVDAKFAKEVSLNPRKSKMQMQLYMSGRLKSICKFEEKQVADYPLSSSFHIFQSRYTSKKEKTMQSSELESGLPDEAEQECIVFFLLVGCRELNSNFPLLQPAHQFIS